MSSEKIRPGELAIATAIFFLLGLAAWAFTMHECFPATNPGHEHMTPERFAKELELAELRGRQAALSGQPRTRNPYYEGRHSDHNTAWFAGWNLGYKQRSGFEARPMSNEEQAAYNREQAALRDSVDSIPE